MNIVQEKSNKERFLYFYEQVFKKIQKEDKEPLGISGVGIKVRKHQFIFLAHGEQAKEWPRCLYCNKTYDQVVKL